MCACSDASPSPVFQYQTQGCYETIIINNKGGNNCYGGGSTVTMTETETKTMTDTMTVTAVSTMTETVSIRLIEYHVLPAADLSAHRSP
jgi:hypothetical protein